ncbi:hypothetical protein EIN_514500 [Entamoeba invadens IP1]|uniref:Uncharacterized protein n=1 Tax=Entamoeba invadens IP1 TaxID=370355 RepID=A0A0A1U6W6_ENTIV|nr:hypothetical protein EIN_514500 [Entamoeba invadens IP1]ELP88652.1 hypothetical protein EIN_514500 [Entamoeba invadens IP1]|eukprot:XP_004255423.1 hypothetical protein EIN_514500 [Entamoeba invadens IP1]
MLNKQIPINSNESSHPLYYKRTPICIIVYFFVYCYSVNTNGILKVIKNDTPIISSEMKKPNELNDVYTFKFTQPTYTNKVINMSNFNYDGKCREIFKYHANNKRDLFIAVGFSGYKNKYWLNNKKEITTIMALANDSFPNAKRLVLLLPGEENKDFENITKSYDNQEKYDRIVIADHRDVFIFADTFQTFSSDNLIFEAECGVKNLKCLDFKQKHLHRWMKETYGINVADQYKNNSSLNLNVGLMLGGTDRIINYLNLMVDNLNNTKWQIWGHDQTVHNMVYYSYYYQKENVTLELCTQRNCFGGFDLEYDAEKKMLRNITSHCSPVLKHKVDHKVC